MERGWKEAEVTTPPSTDRPPPPQTDREGGVSLKNTENGVSFQRFCCVMLKVRRRRGGGTMVLRGFKPAAFSQYKSLIRSDSAAAPPPKVWKIPAVYFFILFLYFFFPHV